MRKGDLFTWTSRNSGKVLFVFDLPRRDIAGKALGRTYENTEIVSFPLTGYYHCLPRELFRNERIGT